MHRLDPVDEILLATYDREVHFLSPLTSNRLELLPALQNGLTWWPTGVVVAFCSPLCQ